MVTFAEELRRKQHQVMGRIINDIGAPQLQVRLVAEVKKVAANLKDAVVLEPPGPKSFDTARKKVNSDYGGDWLRIKDMARCTLVVPTAFQVDAALRALEEHFQPKNGFSVEHNTDDLDDPSRARSAKITLGSQNAAGYSGWTLFVSCSGYKGEIQVNTPALMYAKSMKEFLHSFSPALAAKMKATYSMVPGGLGHTLYETYRVQKKTPVGLAYAAASKAYYDYFRSNPPSMQLGWNARKVIAGLVPPINLTHT